MSVPGLDGAVQLVGVGEVGEVGEVGGEGSPALLHPEEGGDKHPGTSRESPHLR